MSRVVVLDATPLGHLTHPNSHGNALACQQWFAALVAAGHRVVVPEVADYEVRRELQRGRRAKALANLNQLIASVEYLPIDTDQMRLAAGLWAMVRQQGLPTASPRALDADAILAAQAIALNDPAYVVATENPGHLQRLCQADDWRAIPTT